MGIVLSFGLGCLGTVWWKTKLQDQKAVKAVRQVTVAGTQFVNKAIIGLRTAEQRGAEIHVSNVVKKPLIDDELKDILLEFMIDQIKKGKIKVVEDID